jgi:hypothetical protein
VATYTVTGHPLNYTDLGLAASTDQVKAAMHITGVGGSITITLTGPEDTKVKGHGALK